MQRLLCEASPGDWLLQPLRLANTLDVRRWGFRGVGVFGGYIFRRRQITATDWIFAIKIIIIIINKLIKRKNNS